ncbi:MAG: helix-turn-helix domain containing protein [Desulfobacteraceae bacterium]|jgi:transposase|nr:helix-turn-helix domain containing protein [Desulfobacteraceae bacterium]
MKLRRMCKDKYAVIFLQALYLADYYPVFISLSYSKEKIMLDISIVHGIINLTYNAILKEMVMAQKPQHDDSKEKALRDCGALNTHQVSVALFNESDFFDSRDLVQVKYEMLRRVHKEGESVGRAAASFGFSRPSFYKSSKEFERQGIPGLLPRKRGPRSRHKLTAEVLAFVKGLCTGEHPLGTPALLEEVEKHFGIRVHRRTLERALGQQEKKMPRVPRKKQEKLP